MMMSSSNNNMTGGGSNNNFHVEISASSDVSKLDHPQQQLQQANKKASFFIGDNDAGLPTKIIGPDEEEIHANEILVPPDGGWGWMIVLASFLSNMIVDGIIFSFGILLTPIHVSSNYTTPISSIAWVGSLATGFYFLAGPVVSAVANKFGFRVVAVFGSVLASVSILASWYFCRDAPNMAVLFAFYGVIGGIGFGMIYVPAVIAVGFYFEKKRALATGIAICGSGIGTFLFPPIMDKIVERYSWQAALLFQAVIILSCIAFGLLYRPLQPTKGRFEGPEDLERRKSMASSMASPEGTPLLMRIKKAREMQKWDSVNSFNSSEALQQQQQDGVVVVSGMDAKSKAERLYNRARKTSTHSLGGGVLGGLGQTQKRMSVPSMLPSGDSVLANHHHGTAAVQSHGSSSAFVPPAPVVMPRGKSFAGVALPDLHEIAEEDHSEENSSRETSQPPKSEEIPLGESEGKEQRLLLLAVDNIIDGGDQSNPISNVIRKRNSTFITKIGNSTLTIDEMTQSRILRVASRATLNKPMFRDDIFYSGSLLRIPQYANKGNTAVMTSTEWAAAASTAPAGPPAEEPEVLRKMLDLSLLVSPMFLLLSVSGFFTMLGLFVPFMYVKDVAMKSVGVEQSTATILISIIGGANTAGRIVSGYIADRPSINVLFLNNASLTILGLSTAVVPFLSSYAQFVVFAIVFGLAMACFASLRSILVVELLGLEKLTNAFGLMLVFQGIASILGTPLAGFLFEGTGAYTVPFLVAGGFLAFSGVMCYPLNVVKNWEERRNKMKEKAALANANT